MTSATLAGSEPAGRVGLGDGLLAALPRQMGTVVAVVALIGPLVYLRAWPPMATVLSPSMEPGISTGDVVLLQSLDSRPPVPGDVVVVPVPVDVQRRLRYPDRLVHRVMEVTPGRVRTKGDNLEDPDPFTVRPADIEDRVLTVVPGAGRVLGFLQSPFGMLWLVLGAILLVRSGSADRARPPPEMAATEELDRTVQDLTRAVAALERRLSPDS